MKKLIPLFSPKKETASGAAAFGRDLDIDVLARTIWGEARGEGSAGMQAVACVIMNRVRRAQRKSGYWWGDNIVAVCQKPYQFSAWNKQDPNYKKLSSVSARNIHFATALRIARRAAAGMLADPTGGATHYHAAGCTPTWAQGCKPCAVIGRHIFYNNIEY